MLENVLTAFGLKEDSISIQQHGNGLINNTWKLISNNKEFILQKVNANVFKSPEDIAFNVVVIGTYLKDHWPDYNFVYPVITSNGQYLVYDESGVFRMFPFVPFSHTKNVAQEPQQAYEAALQFGRFTYLLSGFDATLLKVTIPSFHDLSLRYENFVAMLKKGNIERIAAAEHLILAAFKYKNIVDVYESIKVNPDFKTRVTHHDTKISNVLFDNNDKGICVIDLDTTMPGYFISDVGDMLRTYVCPVSEEEADYDKICIRPAFYEAIVTGYYAEMKNELTPVEKNSFFYAGSFMIYMQAIRFLTDYLDDDHYYGAKYEGHNLTRAGNQFVLLQKYLDAENKLAYISANL